MGEKRILEYTEQSSVDNTDYMLTDSGTKGSKKYQVSRILTEAEAVAQTKVDAEAAAREAADNELKADLSNTSASLYMLASLANSTSEYRNIKTANKYTFKNGIPYIVTIYGATTEIPGVCYVSLSNVWQKQITYGIKDTLQIEFTIQQDFEGYIAIWAPNMSALTTCSALVCESSKIEAVNEIFGLYDIAKLQNIASSGNLVKVVPNHVISSSTTLDVYAYSKNVAVAKGVQPSNWNSPVTDYISFDNTKIYTCFVGFQKSSDCALLLINSSFSAQWNDLTGQQIEFNKNSNCIKFKPRTSGNYRFSIFGASVDDVFELYLFEGDVDISDADHPWRGKKIVWYGTSIPAGTTGRKYPEIVGRLLGAEVINRAIGSSPVHSQRKSLITEANPYGFTPNFEAASKTMVNDLTRQNWIIEHYNSGVFTINVPSSMSEADAQWIRDHFGCEALIDQYLTDATMPDLFIFDHGHNDNMSEESEYDGTFDQWTFQGAMGFLIQRIKNYNAKARILLVGEYEDQLRPYVSEYQKKVADEWSIPIMPQWSMYGWSQQSLTTKDAWVNGVWTKDALENPQTITELQAALADGVHPYSDATNKTTVFMAKHIAKWLSNFVSMDE